MGAREAGYVTFASSIARDLRAFTPVFAGYAHA
jgi:hypothetical protein